MSKTRFLITRVLFPLVVLLFAIPVIAQTTTFTYQGRLTDGGTLANGIYDLEFALFDNASSGGQVGSTQTVTSVSVSSGIFTVSLDFGVNAFPGANRFLEISARLAGGGSFTVLTPRQQITSTPYAVRSLVASTADGLSIACAGCVQDANISAVDGSKVSSAIPVASVPAGSASYIQNTSSPQGGSNFNISGNGTTGGALSGNLVNATTQYNIAGRRILSASGDSNTFVGVHTGQANSGQTNSFLGDDAGSTNTTGSNNTFVGYAAGRFNATGSSNSFFGNKAGQSNTTASSNAFFGASAGILNTSGTRNSFFGDSSGFNTTTGNDNAFFGSGAGAANLNGLQNSYFGSLAGNNSVGAGNSFFGHSAGRESSGGGNSFFGDTAGRNNTTGRENVFLGYEAGFLSTEGDSNSFLGDRAGRANTTGDSNTFLGDDAGRSNDTGSKNTTLGADADVALGNLSFATAIGAGARVYNSNTIALGRDTGADIVIVPGLLTIPNLAVAGSTQLCRNSFDRIGACSSSLRYKTNLAPYRSGLNFIKRLEPISFTWKDGGMRDLGFGAEDVEKIDPLLVTYNQQGLVEGVKYDRINVVLVNAIKEQQSQIERQQDDAKKQQEQIASLRTANATLAARLHAIERTLAGKARTSRRSR